MDRKKYIQPHIALMLLADTLMQTISENTEETPVVDDGEELGTNSSSVWDEPEFTEED